MVFSDSHAAVAMSRLSVASATPSAGLRALRFAVVTLTLATMLGAAVVLPVARWVMGHLDWREESKAAIAKDKAWIEKKTQLEASLKALQGSPLRARWYPSASDSALINSVQAEVNMIFVNAGANPESMLPVAPLPAGEFVAAGVQVRASMPIDKLLAILEGLSKHARQLRLGRLIVEAPQSQAGIDNPALTVSMDIVGFRLRMDKKDGLSDGKGEGE